jgi:hypothetical protein
MTVKGKKAMETHELFNFIFDVVFNNFNWAYFDKLAEERVAYIGRNYTLYLLDKYGIDWQKMSFYSTNYYNAFFHIFDSDKSQIISYYESRTFANILSLLGLIEIMKTEDGVSLVKISDLFRKYIRVEINVKRL